jgi:hypothetical protein
MRKREEDEIDERSREGEWRTILIVSIFDNGPKGSAHMHIIYLLLREHGS